MKPILTDHAQGGVAGQSATSLAPGVRRAPPSPHAFDEPADHDRGWRRALGMPSLPESNRSVEVQRHKTFYRKMFAYAGPGFMVAVGYMDPGNWATDLAGGSKFGYTLLSVILISNLMAILLQHLCVKLGIVTRRDLAQACRDHFPRPVAWGLWLLCEVAICACDLAEVIGSAIALKLLFGVPMVWGVCLTALDVLLLLALQKRGFRTLEALIITLMATIGVCFAFELWFAQPSFVGILLGFVPSGSILTNSDMLYVAIGILGATVMPHNLYLHSSIVQTRAHGLDDAGKAEAIKYGTIDSTVALMGALFINAAILILSASAFHFGAKQHVAEIDEAYRLLAPTLGVGAAGILFAVALLASGQNSTITGTLAGQIVMEGFINLRLPPWARRLITRVIAIIPAVIVTSLYGDSGTTNLLILSQVVLSLQLPFAVIPLIMFVADRRKMGRFRPSWWVLTLSVLTAAIIVTLNGKMLWDITSEHLFSAPAPAAVAPAG